MPRFLTSLLAILLWGLLPNIHAQTTSSGHSPRPSFNYDGIRSHAQLVKNPDSAGLSELRLIGRYQGQFAHIDADSDSFSDFETRRFRFGFQAKLLRDRLFLHHNWNVGGVDENDFAPHLDTIYETYLRWSLTPDSTLSIGKMKAAMTREYATSSKKILTVERSMLVNQLTAGSPWGVKWSGSSPRFHYTAALFADTYAGGSNQWFDHSGGAFGLLRFGFDTSGLLMETSDISLDLASGSNSPGNAGLGNQHVLSLNYSGKSGPTAIQADLLGGFGNGTEQFGLVLLPAYDLNDRLQLVGRYQYARGSDDSLTLQKRYERKVAPGGAERYHALYAGLNTYFHAHNLKVMTGIEFTRARRSTQNTPLDSVTVFGALRLYF